MIKASAIDLFSADDVVEESAVEDLIEKKEIGSKLKKPAVEEIDGSSGAWSVVRLVSKLSLAARNG